MRDRIEQRAKRIRKSLDEEAQRSQQFEAAAAQHQERLVAARERLPELLAKSRFRRFFLDREEKAVLRQEEARLEREAWIEANCGYINRLCDTFRNWALRAGAVPDFATQGRAWQIAALHSERVETREIAQHPFPERKTFYQTTQWFIPVQQPASAGPRTQFDNIRTYLTESVGSTYPQGRAGYSHQAGLECMKVHTIEPLDDGAASATIAALEEGIAGWVARYPGTPWSGTIEAYDPRTGSEPLDPASFGFSPRPSH